MDAMADWATCFICTESYDLTHRVPKSLDCRHTFCAPCITQVCKTRRECPQCRAPVGNPSDLHNDLTMINYMEQVSQADYASKQDKMRKRLEDAESDLIKLADMLEQKATEIRATFDDISDKNRRVCKARLEHDIAKVVSSLDKNHIIEKALEAGIQDLTNKADLCDKPVTFIRSHLDQRHIVEETVVDSEEKKNGIMNTNTSTINDYEGLYQSYLKQVIVELQTLVSDGESEVGMRLTTGDMARFARRSPRDYTTITKPKAMFGKNGRQPREFVTPTGITVLPSGDILVTEYHGNRAQILTKQGEPILQLGSKGTAEGQFNHPCRAAITADGKIAICDQWNHRLQFFTTAGQYSHSYGDHGREPGQFLSPWDIAIDSRGNVYVVEGDHTAHQHSRVQVFDKTFATSRQFGAGYLKKPIGIAVRGRHVVVCDEDTSRCELFQTDGQHVRTLCTSGSGPGQLKKPGAVAFDRHGNILVSDCENRRIQIITLTGEVVHVITNWDDSQYACPLGITSTDTGDLFVCDAQNDCILVF